MKQDDLSVAQVRDAVRYHYNLISKLQADVSPVQDQKVAASRQRFAKVPTTPVIGTTTVVTAGTTNITTYPIRFHHNHLTNVKQFHIWFRPNTSTSWNRVGSTPSSPAQVTLSAPPTHGQFAIQTEFADGLSTDLDNCPTVAF